MTGVLKTLLEITVYSAVLFVVVLTLKLIFKRQLSAPMHYLLWLLVVARLLVPVTFDSDWKLFVMPQEPAAVQPVAEASGEQAELNFKENTAVTEYAQQPAAVINTQAAETGGQTGAVTTAAAATMKRVNWTAMAFYVWAAGMGIYFGALGWLHVRFRRIVRRGAADAPAWVAALTAACAAELGIRRRIRVCVQSGLSSPALTLSLNPRLLLPKSMLDSMSRAQIALGIRHELTHYKRGDHLMSLLLLALRGVYWFNPVVWISQRMMLADMEAACDVRATLGLGQRQRSLYMNTIIDLGSDAYAHYALGMSAGRGKKEMERRIRGLFRAQRSGRGARLAAVLLVPVLLIACFTTACQPTPEEPIVVNKGDGLGSLIQSTPEASSGVSPSATSAQTNDELYEKLRVPKHWNIETTALDGRINITADVDIDLPNVSQLPAATASLGEFTQEDLGKIAEVLGVKGSEWTKIINVPTKERIRQWIIEDKEEIANSDDSFRVEKAKDNLEAHEQMYFDAPYESELSKTLTEFEMSEEEFYPGTVGVRFEGTTMIDGQQVYFYAGNIFGKSVRTVRVSFGSRFFGSPGLGMTAPYGVSLTKEQAAEQASAIAGQLTDELTLCRVAPAASFKDETNSRNWGWACVFMREINGCPTAYESTDVGSDMESTVSEPVPYEKMVIVMDDMGMVTFEWETPMTIESIDNPDVTLLSFDEIAQRAAAQIGQHWIYSAVEARSNEGKDMSDPGCTAIITKAELGLMRVAKADSADYYYIPVWNFYTDLEHTDDYWERTGTEPYSWDDHDYVDKDGNPETLYSGYGYEGGSVTINALDGSVIDRDKGY